LLECVGFDPGGKRRFGWCVVKFDTDPLRIKGGVSDHAEAALTAAQRELSGPPAAVGIDAPLFWTIGEDRAADREVRKLVRAAGGHNGTVAHVNALRGACLVQGVLIARMAAETWPNAAITEAHPKALLWVSADARTFNTNELSRENEHTRDAALGALAARAGVTGFRGWRDLTALERAPFFPGGRPVSYWFPMSGEPALVIHADKNV
jgi:predicted nuclease with RNAse H fold